MRFSRINIILISIIILNSCCSNYINRNLLEIEKLNKNIDLEDWEIIQHYKTDEEDGYLLEKQMNDTLSQIRFSKFNFEDTSFYWMGDLIMSIQKDSIYHELAFQNDDTLYYFTSEADHSIIRKFEKGKYYYLYKHGKLNWKQRKYFELHRDSLIKITGDNLPDF